MKTRTSIGWYDPRTVKGQLLWPERFGQKEIDSLRTTLGAYGFAGQLQQRPSPAEGGILKRDWWRFYQNEPRQLDAVIFSWDMAFKDAATSDYVVGQVWGRKRTTLYLLDQVRDRMDFTASLVAVQTLRSKWLAKDGLLAESDYIARTLIEDKANGPAIISVLRNKIPAVIGVKVHTSKEARLQAVAPLIEAGNVMLREGASWAHDLIEEAAAFPAGAHDDQLDALSQALAHLMPGVWRPGEVKVEPPQSLEEMRNRQFWEQRVEEDQSVTDRVAYLNRR